jgi:hypothetical protein
MSHHEDSDVRTSAIVSGGVWLAVGTALAALVVWLFFRSLLASADRVEPVHPLAVGQELRLPPEPRLQVQPRQDLDAYSIREEELLTGYHWFDRATGSVRIPIAEAMRRVVEQGLPVRSASPAPDPAEPPASPGGRPGAAR